MLARIWLYIRTLMIAALIIMGLLMIPVIGLLGCIGLILVIAYIIAGGDRKPGNPTN